MLLDEKGRTLFREFRIPARLVCDLKRAAKGTLNPKNLASLADAADLLGGFSFIDDLVKAHKLNSERPTTPKEDTNREYDWKTLYKAVTGCTEDLKEAASQGYMFASFCEKGMVYHLQKKRKEEGSA